MSDPGTGRSPLERDADRIRSETKREANAASGLASDARKAAQDGLRSAYSGASAQARSYAEGGKEAATDSLDNFAHAIRTASDDLGKSNQTMGAQLLGEAAGGLEELSRSLSRSNVGDFVTSIRDFGRRNPTAFIGAAVLAGLAVGRFARASDEHRASSGGGYYPQPDRPDHHHEFQHRDVAAGDRPRAGAGTPGAEANVFRGAGAPGAVRSGSTTTAAAAGDHAIQTAPTTGMGGTAAETRGPTAGQGPMSDRDTKTSPTAGMAGTSSNVKSPTGGHNE